MGQTLSEPNVEKTSNYDKNALLAYGFSAMQGWCLTMEDAHCAELKLGDTEASLFGIFDGHASATAAQITGKHLQELVRRSEYFDKKEYKKALVDAYMTMDKVLLDETLFLNDSSGCTSVTALFTPDHMSIFVANAGDSRCIISSNGKSKALSYDWMASRTDGIPKTQTSLAIKRDEKPLPELKTDSPKENSPQNVVDDEPTVESPEHNA